MEANTRRVAYYTNIPPGEYRFRVMACNNDGVWNEVGASLDFSLKPHFYQTKLFYALSALMLVLLGLTTYLLRVRQLKARQAEAVAGRETTVLLRGETGTGKGLLARLIHDASPRKKEPFVALNCAGLQRELTESELFGHERGAFTGAVERKIGLFEAANGGTLFLDEIGEMDLGVQAKLLSVLEQKRFRRLGGVTEIEVDVRLIAATNRDLAKEMADGRFREDLYYRLNVFAIDLPALRERREDILPLVWHFLREYQGPQAISSAAEEAPLNYSWPGNVRELRNVIERAAILCPPGSELLPIHMPPLGAETKASAAATESASVGQLDSNQPPSINALLASMTMEDVERHYLEAALKAPCWNLETTARDLGLSRATLYRKIKKYNLSPEG